MHPVEDLGSQVRRGMHANVGDTYKHHGQSNARGRHRKVAFRDVSVVEQRLFEHLVPVEGRG